MSDINNTVVKKISRWKKGINLFTQSKTPTASLILIYVLMLIVFSVFSKNYLTIVNFKSILNNMAVSGILASGIVIVMIGGGFDLSIGSMMGFSGIVSTVLLFQYTFIPVWAVIIIAVLIGCALGLVNGLIITKIGINPIITTLGTLAIIRGVCFLWADVNPRVYNPFWRSAGRLFIGNVFPITLVYIIIFFVSLALVLKFTKFERDLYTVGGNENLARLAGINVDKIKIISYIVSGFFSAIAAIVLTSQLGSGRPEYGEGAELEVLTIVVLGGVAVGGGKGNYIGTFISLLIIGSISNGLALLDVPIFLRIVIKGALLVFAVVIDALRNRKRLQLY